MKNIIHIIVLTIAFVIGQLSNVHAQVGINEDGISPDSSAMLDIRSLDKGILIPRMDSTARKNIAAPADGLLVYDNSTTTYWYYDNAKWNEIRNGTTAISYLDFSDSLPDNDLDLSCSMEVEELTLSRNIDESIVAENFMYVIDRETPDSFYVFDISDPLAPTFIKGTGLSPDPEEVIISGQYAYIIHDEPSDNFTVIDISDPLNLIEVSNISVGSRLRAIDIVADYAYLVDENGDLIVVNISDPTSPIIESTVNVTFNFAAMDLVISANYAYLLNNSTLRRDVSVFDVSDILNPIFIDSLDFGNFLREIKVVGSYAYVIESMDEELIIIDISDPSNLNIISNTSLGANPRELRIANGYAFIATGNTTGGLKIVDISDPVNPVLESDLSVTAASLSLNVFGSHAYIPGNNLSVVSITPCDPFYVGLNGFSGELFAISENDNLGNHIATENIQLSDFYISNDGDSEGIAIDDGGKVSIDSLSIADAYTMPTMDGTSSQILTTDGNGTVSWTDNHLTSLSDTDNDTKIQVEESSDEDIIRFDLGGTEFMRLDSGRIEVLNTGGSIFLGSGAGAYDDYSDNYNVFIGESTGLHNTTGSFNSFIGPQAGYNNSSANANTFTGYQAGYANTTGVGNVFSGPQSGYNNITGNHNMFTGVQAGYSNTSGDRNIFMGNTTGYTNSTGTDNIFLGSGAGYFNSTGDNNTFFGTVAGFENTMGSNNTFIGKEAGHSNTTSDGNIFIGYQAGYNETNSSKLYIENSNSSTPLIYGDFAADSLQVNGKLNINGAYNFPTTDGIANQVLTTDGNGIISWSDENVSAFNSENGVTSSNTNTDDFLFGADSLNHVSGIESKFLFDKNTGSFRIGQISNDNWNADSLGLASFAAGTNTKATVLAATAFGENTTASGIAAMAMGTETTASGLAATAFGQETIASGGYATAFGIETSASGSYSTAFGQETRAENAAATAFGSFSVANGFISTAFGLQTEAQGSYATAFGESTTASASHTTAFGGFTLASGDFATAFGRSTSAPSYGETAIGFNNTTYSPTNTTGYNANDRLFVVGNGLNASNPSDALRVYKNGDTELNGALTIDSSYTFPIIDGTVGQVLQTDGNGNVSWGSGSEDNLGDHTATQNIQTNGNWLSNDSDNEGISIDDTGYVTLSGGIQTSNPLILNHAVDTVLTGTPSADGFRIRTVEEYFNENEEAYIFEKTDGNQTNPDGGIVFANTGSDGVMEDALIIRGSGRVGVKRNPTTNAFEVNGEASKSSAGDWVANSDARLKKNISQLNSQQVLSQLLALQGVTYEWNDTLTGNDRPDGMQYGFTAQNIQKVFPELVSEDNQGFLQTAYGTYDAMYIEAIRALNEKNKSLTKQVEYLESQVSEIDQLKLQNTEMKAMLQQIQAQLNHQN